MLFKSIALAAVFLASASSAFDIHERHLDLEERNGGYGGASGGYGPGKYGQSYKFAPGIQTATGDTCAAAFGNGYQTCREAAGDKNRLCYNPDAGQKCCSASWSCPNGSFCLGDGVCCPDGMDPASCGAAAVASSSAAAAKSSAPASSTASASISWAKVKPSISSGVSVKPVATTFAPIGSKPAVTSEGEGPAPEATGPAQVSVNGAMRDSLSAAGIVGAGFLAVLAAY